MLIGKIHPGSGLGDQLFSYIITRTIALDKGYEFGFVGKEFFKGTFLELDWGKDTSLDYWVDTTGKINVLEKHQLFEINKPYYDPEVNFIEDGAIIDGYGAQDEKYWGHRLEEIGKWLVPKGPVKFDDLEKELCVINFRGGEFKSNLDLFLLKSYYTEAIEIMKSKYPDVKFEVHTDDPITAKEYFPDFPIYKDIQLNWEAVRYAKHLIISNSAFAIIPALLNKNVKEVIAPRYWARRNTKVWSMPSNYYKKFTYI